MNEYKVELPMIYAVDFDGTLCENNWPGIGAPNWELIHFLIHEQRHDAVIILWTMREGELLDAAVKWLGEHGLTPDVINDNAETMKTFYGNNPRKVFANVYIDDHNAKSALATGLPYKEVNNGNK